MIYLIDIGNSRTKYVQCIESAEIIEDIENSQSSATKSSLTNCSLTDTVQLMNKNFNYGYFAEHFKNATRIIVANVANSSLTASLEQWCSDQGITFTQVFSEKSKDTLAATSIGTLTGKESVKLTSAYQEPSTLGIDRWLALLATIRLYPNEQVLIIDAGTATTVDLLNSNGQHQGGWILAGVNALFNSILSNSTLVHAELKNKSSLAFGSSTSDNVNNACWAATLGMIQQSILQAKQQGNIDRIILTGGNGKALITLLLAQKNAEVINIANIQFIDNLIFYGLQAYIPNK